MRGRVRWCAGRAGFRRSAWRAAARRVPLGAWVWLAASCGPAAFAPDPVVQPKRAEVAPVIAEHLPDRSKLPEPSKPRSWAPPVPQSWRLRNGIRVWYLEQGPTPLVTLMLVGLRGSATDPAGQAGLTELTADMLDEGAAGLTALQISERLQELATDYTAAADVDPVLLIMHLLADTFEPSAQLLGDMVLRPEFPKAEFDRRKQQRIAEALANESQPSWARAVALRRVLFGDGYASELSSGTRRTLGNLTLRRVKAHYRKLFAPDSVQFVVVGGVAAELVRQALEAAFGDWKGQAGAAEAPLSAEEPRGIVAIVDFPEATQSVLAVARRAEGAASPDYFPELVYNRELGGAFSSRLNLNLREDKGYTYGARSLFRRWRDAGYFGLFADVQTAATRASVDESVREVADFCRDRPLTTEQRDEAVSGLLLGFPGRFERVSTVAARFSTLPVLGRPADWFARWSARVQAVDLAAANRVARKYCAPDQYVVVIAGDRKSIEPQLEGVGQSIVHYDAQGNRLDK
jgi:zinc protease